ncbi:MAG: phosphoglycerate dehydrogenase [Elusimicrobiota bacterium]
MQKKVVYVALQQFCENDSKPLEILEKSGLEIKINKLGRRLVKEEMPTVLKGVDGVLAGVEPYEDSLFAQCPTLKCISRCGIGTDAVDLTAAKKRNVTVIATADEVTQPVAEITVGMILALIRHFPEHIHEFKANQWRKHSGFLIGELTIGLIGFGRIGRAVQHLLHVFGAKILVCDPFLNKDQIPKGVELVDFHTLLKRSDVVSLHPARRPEDGYLITAKELAMMKEGAYLINTSRGYLIDEKALYQSLKQEHLAGAGLDVFESEPYKGALTEFSNVLCTPHVATLTRASRAAMEIKAAENLVTFFKK